MKLSPATPEPGIISTDTGPLVNPESLSLPDPIDEPPIVPNVSLSENNQTSLLRLLQQYQTHLATNQRSQDPHPPVSTVPSTPARLRSPISAIEDSPNASGPSFTEIPSTGVEFEEDDPFTSLPGTPDATGSKSHRVRVSVKNPVYGFTIGAMRGNKTLGMLYQYRHFL